LLEAAVEHMPKDPSVLIHLAKLDLGAKRPASAERWARRALKVDSHDTEAEFTLAAILQSQGRWKEAAAVLEKHHKDTALLKRLARVLQQEAEKPNTNPDDLCEVGTIFLRTNARVGLFWLHRALERNPNHQAAHKTLAEYYQSKGDLQKAGYHRSQLKPDGKTTSPQIKPPKSKRP
jgi:Tfp pilus assembly protein PilF